MIRDNKLQYNVYKELYDGTRCTLLYFVDREKLETKLLFLFILYNFMYLFINKLCYASYK